MLSTASDSVSVVSYSISPAFCRSRSKVGSADPTTSLYFFPKVERPLDESRLTHGFIVTFPYSNLSDGFGEGILFISGKY